MYLRVLQTFLSQLPVSPARPSCPDSASDSEDDSTEADQQSGTLVSSRPAQSCADSAVGLQCSLGPGPLVLVRKMCRRVCLP